MARSDGTAEALGAGSFGSVFKEEMGGRAYALKFLEGGGPVGDICRRERFSEDVRSPFVQTVLLQYYSGTTPVLFYDVCAGSVCDVAEAACNTHRQLHPSSPADVGLVMGAEGVRPVFAEMAAALTAVHAAGYAHCDVKPSNFLVSQVSAATRTAGECAGGKKRENDWGKARQPIARPSL